MWLLDIVRNVLYSEQCSKKGCIQPDFPSPLPSKRIKKHSSGFHSPCGNLDTEMKLTYRWLETEVFLAQSPDSNLQGEFYSQWAAQGRTDLCNAPKCPDPRQTSTLVSLLLCISPAYLIPQVASARGWNGPPQKTPLADRPLSWFFSVSPLHWRTQELTQVFCLLIFFLTRVPARIQK